MFQSILGKPFSHQSNKHTYHEILHDFPTVEVNDFKDSAVSLLANDERGEFSVNASAAWRRFMPVVLQLLPTKTAWDGEKDIDLRIIYL